MKHLMIMMLGMTVLSSTEKKLKEQGKESFTINELKTAGMEAIEELLKDFSDKEEMKSSEAAD